MTITETPKVRYYESESNPTLSGEGAQIPCFIGISENDAPKKGVQKFKNFQSVYKTVENGGIGTNLDANPLLCVINDFFKEVKKNKSDDKTVPYIYVIDLGKATVANAKPWIDAMSLAKSKRDMQAEIYVGFKKEDDVTNVVSLLESAAEIIKEDSESGNPRIAYFTIENADDDELIAYTDDTKENYLQNPRIGLCEPKYFGRIIAKICTTPSYEEPGYTDFRSIPAGEFNTRTPEIENNLQEAGIIFIRDELASSEIHPRINLAVSTAFATTPDNRPNDALLHARRNVDQLVREVYDVLHSQLKRNETETNLSFLQTDINVVVSEKIDAGHMMEGTIIDVAESDINPFDLRVEGAVVPVNSTLLVGFSLYVESPNAIAGGN